MLVSELVLEIMREWSETPDTDKVTLVESWVRNAIDDFVLITNFRILKTGITIATQASVDTYTLPVALREITNIRIPTLNVPLEERTGSEPLFSQSDLEETGRPEFWWYTTNTTVSNDTALRFRLYPVPDAVYSLSVEGVIHPNALVSTSVIPLHVEHIGILKEKIRSFMHIDDKDYEAADRADRRYMQKANLIVSRENARPTQQRRLRVSDVPRQTNREFVRLDPNRFSR